MSLPKDKTLKDLPNINNLADLLEEEQLLTIGKEVVEGFTRDKQSRYNWELRYKNGMELVAQISDKKNKPWVNASNVKYPLLSIAATQFHARAFPQLVGRRDLVKISTIGFDPEGTKAARARRVSLHMNYQFLRQMKNWSQDMDRLLLALPITGCEFKKIYWDADEARPECCLVYSKDLVIDYYAKSIEDASRVTEIIQMSTNELFEACSLGYYRDIFAERENQVTTGEIRNDLITNVSNKIQGLTTPSLDKYSPRQVLEQHTWYDLDEDGYKEPYIITVDKESGFVYRIVARFQSKNIKYKKGVLVEIEPDVYYEKYDFIPSPDGGIYGMGFGTLIGPLNDAVNTLINQLVDAGTLSNLQAGFVSKSFRTRGGSLEFSPGEWKIVNITGNDIKQGVFPLPVRDPSQVLFSLLGLLIDSGRVLTSTVDMMVGENPGQNQKVGTTMAVLDQGQKVFTAIYQRIFKAMSNEFEKVYNLNDIYFDIDEYLTVLDPPKPVLDAGAREIFKYDYNTKDLDVFPTADPFATDSAQKLQIAMALIQAIPVLGLNPLEVGKRYLEALGIDDPEKLLPNPEMLNRPNPDTMLEAQKLDLDRASAQADYELRSREQDRKDIEVALKEVELRQKETQHLRDVKASIATKQAELAQKESSDRRNANAKSNSK